MQGAGWTLAMVVVVIAAGCGGTSKPRPPAKSPASIAASAIEARLVENGYPVVHSPSAAVVGGTPSKPRGELAAFDTEVDFTSPDSFKLQVVIFDSHSEVERWFGGVRTALVRGLARCRLVASCRLRLIRDGVPKLPAYRIVGPAFYSASTDNPAAKLPMRKFLALVALASGG
jgi:hypothetical protein